MKYVTNTCPACEESFEFSEQEIGREWICPHCGVRVLLHAIHQPPVPPLHNPGKTYTYPEITSAVVAQVRAASDQSSATIRRITKDYFDSMARNGIKLDARFDPRGAVARVERWVKAEISTNTVRPPWAATPLLFSHWVVKSKKNNAVLCFVTKNNYAIGREPQQLGLFWEFQSPDSEFVYLPAVIPRNSEGKTVMNLDFRCDVGPVVCYKRNMDRGQMLRLYRTECLEDAYWIKYEFTVFEAKAHVDFLKQINRGTVDDDDSVYSERIVPSLEWGFNHLCPMFSR